MKIYIAFQSNRPGQPEPCRDEYYTSTLFTTIFDCCIYTLSIYGNSIGFSTEFGYAKRIFFEYGFIDDMKVLPILFLRLAIAF
jgi:hypothetical protein